MPNIPGYCDHCDVWTQSPINTPPTGEIELQDINTVCRQCKRIIPIISGTYKTIGNAIEIVKSSNLNEVEIRTLRRILEEARANHTSATEIGAQIKKEVPAASKLSKYFTEGANLRADIGILLGIIAILLSIYYGSQVSEEGVAEKVVEKLLHSTPRTHAEPGVNQPCWCDSGRKYKKCHGSTAHPDTPANTNKQPK